MTSKDKKTTKAEELNKADLDQVQGGLKMTDPDDKGFTATDDLWVKGEGKTAGSKSEPSRQDKKIMAQSGNGSI